MDEPMEVFVGGLRELGDSVDEQELRDHFGAFGEVLKLELTRDRRRHDQRGFCFVTFAHKSAALACLEHEEHTIRGMRIAVERAIRDTGAGKANGKKRTRRSRRPARDANLPPRAAPPPALQCPPPHVPFLGRAPISEPPSAPLQRQSSGMGMMWPFRPHVADTRYVLPSTQPATPITGPHDGDVWGFDVGADTVHAPVPPATPASGGRFLLHRFASASNVIAPSKLETMTGGYSTASNTPNPAATPSSGWRFGSRAVEPSTPVYPQPSPMFFQHDRVAPSPRHHRRHFG
ncbi:hypothetical protein JKP88DRAFT_224660 [Tribonema minus]|uniref:RRM domain-containing protein n=1 Tax=Tribonema minus TaxID=303371 RepID=A0A836CBK2_9STRA|nr:hypothetical protein JKP88DRAFT_224660 [Tribonema minus]